MQAVSRQHYKRCMSPRCDTYHTCLHALELSLDPLLMLQEVLFQCLNALNHPLISCKPKYNEKALSACNTALNMQLHPSPGTLALCTLIHLIVKVSIAVSIVSETRTSNTE